MPLCLKDNFLRMLASEIRSFCQWMTYARLRRHVLRKR